MVFAKTKKKTVSSVKELPVHPTYLDANVQKQIMTAYKANPLPSVQLQGFLLPEVYSGLMRELNALKYTDETVADRYSRLVAAAPKSAKLFASHEFKSFVKKMTGKTIKGKLRVERYAHRNYTLRNDDEKPPGLLVYFDCSPLWHPARGGATIISDERAELARVQPMHNSLVLVDCAKAWPFFQYINHRAGKDALLRIIIE